jgi:hypothetical protein
MAEKGSPASPPGIVTPFQNAVVHVHGKGNKNGLQTTKGSGPGKAERGS